jgi:Zn-dependent protease
MGDPALFILRIPAILLSLTIHEYCHGLVALWCKDTTARDAGRLSFNPLSHLDPFGALMLLFGPFGWAKPVPVNGRNFGHPRRDIVFVSAAGPVSNILLAFAVGFLMRGLNSAGLYASLPSMLKMFFELMIFINLGLSFFNLLPIPPLDGSNIVFGLLPPSKAYNFMNAMRRVPMIFLVLMVVQWAFKIPVINWILDPIWNPYVNFFQSLIFGGH